MTGWVLVLCGLSMALSQVPTLHPDVGVFVLGIVVLIIGGGIVADRPSRR